MPFFVSVTVSSQFTVAEQRSGARLLEIDAEETRGGQGKCQAYRSSALSIEAVGALPHIKTVFFSPQFKTFASVACFMCDTEHTEGHWLSTMESWPK
jgi:hypothetical protein